MISRISPFVAVALLLMLPRGVPGREPGAGSGEQGGKQTPALLSAPGFQPSAPSPMRPAPSSHLSAPGTPATLHFSNGDYLAGELLSGDETGNLRWQGSAFAAPLTFPLNAVSAVSFAARGPRPHPQGPYCLELEGGDVLFGTLVGLSNQQVQFDSPGLGMVQVERSAVRRILHCREGADLIYLGPNGQLEWKENPAGAWEQDAGRLFTARHGASLVGELGLPKQACLDFELSWTEEPDFTFAFGTNADAQWQDPVFRVRQGRVGPAIDATNAGAADQGPVFRLEVWNRHLVLLGETPQTADLASLQTIGPGAGRCHFRMYLDQQHQRAIVFAADGRQLADLVIADAATSPGACLRLVNHRGNVRLEQLSIARWNGQPPHASQGDKSQLQRSDGTVVNGQIEKLDAATGEFVIAQGNRQSRVPADAVESIVLPSSGSPPACGLRHLRKRRSPERQSPQGGKWPIVAEPPGHR